MSDTIIHKIFLDDDFPLIIRFYSFSRMKTVMMLREFWRSRISKQISACRRSQRFQVRYKNQCCKSTTKTSSMNKSEGNNYSQMARILVLMRRDLWSKWRKISTSRLKKLKQNNSLLKLWKIRVRSSNCKIDQNTSSNDSKCRLYSLERSQQIISLHKLFPSQNWKDLIVTLWIMLTKRKSKRNCSSKCLRNNILKSVLKKLTKVA